MTGNTEKRRWNKRLFLLWEEILRNANSKKFFFNLAVFLDFDITHFSDFKVLNQKRQ